MDGNVHSMNKTIHIYLLMLLVVFSTLVMNIRPNQNPNVQNISKLSFENSYYVDSNYVGETETTEMKNTHVIVSVVLDYDRRASTMYKEGNKAQVDVTSDEYKNIIDSIYVPEHEEYYKNYHTLKNREIIANVKVGDYESMYISTLTPFVEYTFTLWQFEKNKDTILKTFEEFDKISKIYVMYTSEDTYVDSTGGITRIAGAKTDCNTGAYTGDGITVGILEPGIIDVDHSNMQGKNITVHNQSFFIEQESVHATQVASIIGGAYGIAPDVDFLTSAINGGISEELDWLVDHGADIINMSFNESNPTGNYNSYSAYVDYLTRVYNQIFIISAGNTSNSNYNVGNPGLAQNAVTVGAIDSSYEWCEFSCYTSNGPTKPNILVKGSYIGIVDMMEHGIVDGTSYSAAGATGMMAMLLEKYPALINKPQKVLSLMSANAKRHSDLYYYDMDNNYDEFMGAGEFNYLNMKNNYGNSFDIVNSIDAASGIIYRYEFTLDAGETMQAAIAWLSYADENDSSCETTDYDIKLLYNNLIVSYGCSLVDNVEMVNFTAEYDNSECAILIVQTSTRAMQTETVSFSYNIS